LATCLLRRVVVDFNGEQHSRRGQRTKTRNHNRTKAFAVGGVGLLLVLFDSGHPAIASIRLQPEAALKLQHLRKAAMSDRGPDAKENGLAGNGEGSIRDAIRQERRRISRDLHDHAGQYLVGIMLRLTALEQVSSDPSVRGAFAEIRRLLSRFGDELVAISAGELRGVPLSGELIPALAELAGQWERETGIPIRFHAEQATGIEPDDATTEMIFRIAQEALTNVAKHATKASQVNVRLEFAHEQVELSVEDDGEGLNSYHGEGRPIRRGGIINMHERLAERGGQLVVFSPPTGGTKVVAMVPARHGPNSSRTPTP
jgi:signal transduction histidine kinase